MSIGRCVSRGRVRDRPETRRRRTGSGTRSGGRGIVPPRPAIRELGAVVQGLGARLPCPHLVHPKAISTRSGLVRGRPAGLLGSPLDGRKAFRDHRSVLLRPDRAAGRPTPAPAHSSPDVCPGESGKRRDFTSDRSRKIVVGPFPRARIHPSNPYSILGCLQRRGLPPRPAWSLERADGSDSRSGPGSPLAGRRPSASVPS
jgi:hypothetical protein